MQTKYRRFSVIERSSYYAVYDFVSRQERAMSDGVDQNLGHPVGSEKFRKAWQDDLNQNQEETAEAYGFKS